MNLFFTKRPLLFCVLLAFTSAVFLYNCSGNQSKEVAVQDPSDSYLLIGTYSQRGSEGIYVFSFDNETGEMRIVSTNNETPNPSYLTISGNNVYAASETGGKQPGSVSSYEFDRKTGELRFLNNVDAGGNGTCYVSTDSTGKFVGVANYSTGSMSIIRTADDGSLLPEKQVIQNEGTGFIPGRQAGPHGHQVYFAPDQKFVVFTDLGLDKFSVYSFDKDSPEPLSFYKDYQKKEGTGPRHFIFHPNGRFAYLVSEITGTITAYNYNNGEFDQIQEFNTWAPRFNGDTDGSAIKISPDGKFLYVSCRGDQNVMMVYAIDQENGTLNNVDKYPVEGFGPRDFDISPNGKYLVVANYASNNLVTFKRDTENGFLSFLSETSLPIPVSVKFDQVR